MIKAKYPGLALPQLNINRINGVRIPTRAPATTGVNAQQGPNLWLACRTSESEVAPFISASMRR
jgi:hypothetical protein